MRNVILILITLILAACGGESTPGPVTEAAQEQIAADGIDATITDVMEGDPTAFGTDELYCVATDGTNPNTQLPYLVAVYGEAGSYESVAMAEGYYEWDLYGCPRPAGE
jgi:hypothetical protein